MSKLNSTKTTKKRLFNEEILCCGFGKEAAKQSTYTALRRCVLANLLWEDNAYIEGTEIAKAIKTLVPLCDPEDVYNLAIEARRDQKLRHTPLYLASLLCKVDSVNKEKYVAKLLPKIITRADMLTDFLAIYWKDQKTPLSAQAKKGLAAAFHNFNEYQFAKYDTDAPIKLRDVMFLCHPIPISDEEEVLFSKIASRTLDTPDTWEVALSSGKNKKETWERLIQENRLGSLAFLRNLDNMTKAGVTKEIIKEGLDSLHSSMLLPLDFLKAYTHNPKFKEDIERAMIKAFSNLPKLKGKTLLIVDVSGSMYAPLSAMSEFTRLDAAKAMAMLAVNQCEEVKIVCTGGEDSTCIGKHKEIKNPSKGFSLDTQLDETCSFVGGGGIFTNQCLNWCKETLGKDFDRIIVFSDSQDCDRKDKRKPSPFGKRNYICDVSAHKRGINFTGSWDAEISGFSEHFLTFIASYEGLVNAFEEL